MFLYKHYLLLKSMNKNKAINQARENSTPQSSDNDTLFSSLTPTQLINHVVTESPKVSSHNLKFNFSKN